MRADFDRLMSMEFPERLATLRQAKGMTQVALAEAIGIHASQVRRYEAGKSQPTLDVIRKLAVTLGVSSDALLFDKEERGPDDELRLQFEAAQRLDPHEKEVVKSVLDSILMRHDAKQWMRPEDRP